MTDLEEKPKKKNSRSERRNRSRRRKQEIRKQKLQALHDAVLHSIPDQYIDLYPRARMMGRHFTVHIGPTNSGKTYDAVQALMKAESGVYLGPLRLLAYEQYENLNRKEVPCNLLTGEERYDTEGAKITASTIEMCDFSRTYDVAVIDEGQMVGDLERGGAWTAAILGLCAEEIHLCASENAEEILLKLIEECDDDYDVVYHERQTPLLVEDRSFRFPGSVQPGDALIVYSRRSVHAVAAELQRHKIPCSMIYGALPYDVRHEQARRFAEGETKVVVATDAIGMGLNMPIRRIVFLEMQKFDGFEKRDLRSDEIKQVAGRAGRYGIYEEGYVSSLGQRPFIRHGLKAKDKPVEKAVISFPESLLDIDASLLDLLKRWAEIPVHEGYMRENPQRAIRLTEIAGEWSKDKYFLYQCITIPFDEKDNRLLSLWREMVQLEAYGETLPFDEYIPYVPKRRQTADDLEKLTQSYARCDLLYSYADKFHHTEAIPDIMEAKRYLSTAIMHVLAKEKLRSRRCRMCGREIPWNYPHAVCERCMSYRRWRRNWEKDLDNDYLPAEAYDTLEDPDEETR